MIEVKPMKRVGTAALVLSACGSLLACGGEDGDASAADGSSQLGSGSGGAETGVPANGDPDNSGSASGGTSTQSPSGSGGSGNASACSDTGADLEDEESTVVEQIPGPWDNIRGVTNNGDDVYVLSHGGLYLVAAEGTSRTLISDQVPDTIGSPATPHVLTDTHYYFPDQDQISRVVLADGTVEAVSTDLTAWPDEIQLVGDTLYTLVDRKVVSLPADGGPSTLVHQQPEGDSILSFVVDGASLYFAQFPNYWIGEVPLTGGEVSLLNQGTFSGTNDMIVAGNSLITARDFGSVQVIELGEMPQARNLQSFAAAGVEGWAQNMTLMGNNVYVEDESLIRTTLDDSSCALIAKGGTWSRVDDYAITANYAYISTTRSVDDYLVRVALP